MSAVSNPIGINDIYTNMLGGDDKGLKGMEKKVADAAEALSQKSDIQPSDLLEMQVNMTMYTTELQMVTSIAKSLGDAAKGVARNMS